MQTRRQEYYARIPEELKASPFWVNWKLEIVKGKETKVPYQVNGKMARTNTASTWGEFDSVVRTLDGYSGIGYVFSMSNAYIAIDIDHCIVNGTVSEEAKEWVGILNSYTEISQSGTGLHIICKSPKLEIYKKLKSTYGVDTGKKSDKGECYIDKRYFAITGQVYDGRMSINHVDISTIISFIDYISTKNSKSQRRSDTGSPEMTDDEIIKKATSAKNGFVFTELYNEIGADGNSEGDQSICNILAFYTQDVEQIKRILRNSPRYRGKFDRDDYLDRSIEKAINDTETRYDPESYKQDSIEKIKKEHPWYNFSFGADGRIRKKLMPDILADRMAKDNMSISNNGDIYIYENGVYRIRDKSEINKITKNKLIVGTITTAQIEEVNKLWGMDTWVKHDCLNLHKDMINFKNCMLRIDKEGGIKTVKHSAEYLSTVQYKVKFGEDVKIDRWRAFLSEVLEPDSIQLLQEVLGYLLTLDNRAKKMFLLYGPTDCGKSVILNVLTAMVGKEYISSKTLQHLCDPDKPFASFALWGKVLNICGDLPATPLKDTGIIKQLTGEDLMDFEQKGKDSFSAYSLARLLFSCNQLPPSYNDRTSAFYNRLQLVYFPHSIPKSQQDERLAQYLIDNELSGIANWAISGYLRLIKNKYVFTTSVSSERVINEYKKTNNPAMDFFEECCDFGIDYTSTSQELYNNYGSYCSDNGLRPLSMHKFKPELELYAKNKGYSIEHKNRLTGSRQRGFMGVRCDYSFN